MGSKDGKSKQRGGAKGQPTLVDRWLGAIERSDGDELMEMRRAFEGLIEHIPGMAYRCENDSDWTMRFVSHQAYELTGYRSEELVDSSRVAFADLIHPDDREGVYAKVQKALGERRPFQIAYRMRTKVGRLKWVTEQGAGVFEHGEVVALEGFISDITEMKRVEGRHLRAQKMNSIGRFVERLSQELEDDLSVISSYAALLEEAHQDRRAEEGEREDLARIVEAANEASETLQQLVHFTRPSRAEGEPVGIGVELDGMVETLQTVVGTKGRLALQVADGLWATDIERESLQEMLFNLVENARQAIAEGGEIVIEVANCSVDEGFAYDHVELKVGDYVVLRVEDDGEGMDEETMAQSFDPYFTTRGEGHEGLGLTAVYGLARQVGGDVALISEPGEGTTVSVFLPRAT